MNNEIRYAGLTFTDDEIMGGEVYSATSLLSDSLEIGTLSVDLYVRDPAVWDKLAGFKRNDKLTYYHKGKLRGTYYIENVERTGKYTFTLSANDAMALLDQSNHMGGIYTGQTVGELVADICNIPYQVQSKFARIKLYGWLPIATRRANLSQVLFAVGAHAKVDMLGALRIEALWDGVSSTIPPSRVFMGDKVKYEAKVSEVSVLEHQYIPGTEEVKLFEGATLDGDVIQFNEPAHDLVASGFTIIEQGANYAKVSSGNGTLTGKKYAHTTKDVRKPVTALDVPNVVEVSEATLISLVNSSAVADRLAGYYKYFETMQADVVYKGEIPGDVVSFEHPFGGESVGCIKSASISMGGALVAEEKTVIGYRPEQTSGDVENKREFIYFDKEWIEPEGIVSLRAVLISGGVGGSGGNNGDSGESGGTSPGKGGKGGKGGDGGRGGRILQIDIPVVSPGKKHTIKIGAGGAGGQSETPGLEGTDTTFDSYSSSNGASSDAGFFDPVTQETFALPGANGSDGADGGRGGIASGYPPNSGPGFGEPGKDSPSRKGGAGGAPETKTSEKYGTGTGYGGGGGGASYKNNGVAGNPGRASNVDDILGTGPGVLAQGGAGGYGASGISSDEPYGIFGEGGAGGHGGGGGGGGGGATGKDVWRSPGGPGGLGGYGGRAGDGCVILFYSVEKQTAFGEFRDKNNRGFLDKLGRRIIV